MAISSAIRKRLEMQGFCGLGDARLAEAEPWLRFTPALCAAIVAIGTVLSAEWLLFTLVPFAALGAILPFHPFDLIYNLGIRRITGTRPLPPNGAPRRFACGIAAVWITAIAASFAWGPAALGYALGGGMVAAALLVATTHFCIPSFIYRSIFGWDRGVSTAP